MILDEQWIAYNKRGWIPGPSESEEEFLQRVALGESFYKDPELFFTQRGELPPFPLAKKVFKPRWSWTTSYLLDLFDFAPDSFRAFFDNQDLPFLQGATTWILEVDGKALPLLQLREELASGSFLKIYSLEEIITHEAIHAARAAFQEPKFEEFFAYATSSSFLRRIVGPMVGSVKGMLLFTIAFFCSVLFQWLSFFFEGPFSFLSLIFGYGLVSVFSFVLFCQLRKRWIFRRAFQKFFKIFQSKKKAMALLFRLRDREIYSFARMKEEKLHEFIEKENSFRWKVLRLCYFK